MAKTTTRGRPRSKPAPEMDTIRAVERGKSYPLDEFLKLTGWSKEALRNRRDEGLRIVYIGREAWINGNDFNDFIESKSRATSRWVANEPKKKSRSFARQGAR